MVSSQPVSRRVVITGMGVVCPLGRTPDELWQALQAGRSGIAALTPAAGVLVPFGGEAREFKGEIDDFGPLEPDKKKAIRKGLKTLCRESVMGLAAAQRSLTHAGLTSGTFDPQRIGVVFGTDYMLMDHDEFARAVHECRTESGQFDFSRWVSSGFEKLFPLWLLKYLPNMPAAHLGIYNDLRGPSNSITLREAAANLAVAEACRVVARGHADIMVAGATGTRVHPMQTIHAVQWEELASNGAAPEAASRPFDLRRSGMVLGEGAGAVVLESLESAVARGAVIHGEIVGFGSSTVTNRRLAARRDQALSNALRVTLRNAAATLDDIGHIQAHGLSTRSCDADEARAIVEVFGDRAKTLPVTAAKSYFGNLGAGSGLVELIAGLSAIQDGRLFPILNFETPDPECPIHAVRTNDVPAGDAFLNLNVTPQGQASCVMVRRYRC